jgi:hypothetical protein
MADRKISDLTALTTPASGDFLPIVDISEAAAASKNKRITIEELMRGVPDGTAAAPGIAFETDPNTGIYSPGADQLAVATNGTGRLFISAGGNIGVQVTPNTFWGSDYPSLQIGKAAVLFGRNAVNDQTTLANNIFVNSANQNVRLETGTAHAYRMDSGGHIWYTATSGTGSTAATLQEYMRLDSSGRLGIGSSAPVKELTVVGDIAVGNSGNSGYRFYNASPTAAAFRWYIANDSNDNFLKLYRYDSSGAFAAQVLTVDTSNRVGIGTTSPTSLLHCSQSNNGITSLSVINNNTGTSARSDIIATSDSADIRMFATSAAYTGVSGWADAGILSTSSNSSNGLILNATAGGIKFAYSGSERARIDSSGRLLIGTSTARSNFFNTTASAALQIEGQGGAGDSRRVAIISNDNTALAGGNLVLAHQRSGSVGGNTIVNINDIAGRLSYQGNDGAQFVEAASINCEVDGTPGANDMPGRLVFSTTADGGSSPSERLRITSSGRVGIGTSSPGYPLTVLANGAANTNNVVGHFYNYGSYSTRGLYIYNGRHVASGRDNAQVTFDVQSGGSNGTMLLQTDGNTALTIDGSQRVGIGTASPGENLAVSSDVGMTVVSINAGGGLSSRLLFKRANTNRTSITSDASDNIIFANEPLAAERARIDSSGRLLVGTSTARANFNNSTESAALQLEGTAANRRLSITGADNAAVTILARQRSGAVGGNTIVQDSDAIGLIRFEGSDGSQFVQAAGIQCEVDGTPGANDMPGSLVFSTTPSGAASPVEWMRINNLGLTTIYAATGAAATGPLTASTFYSGQNGSRRIIIGKHSATNVGNGTVCFYVDDRGNVANTNNSYTAISDIKLKENIVGAKSQWDDIKALRVVNYNFKPETNFGTHTQIGLIAQEVEPVSPNLVNESPDVDENGIETGTVTKCVNYSVLYMKAVKALQEAMERIEQLEARVSLMRHRLAVVVPFSKMLGSVVHW